MSDAQHHALGGDILEVIEDGPIGRTELMAELKASDSWAGSSADERTDGALVDAVLRRLVTERAISRRPDGRYALVLTRH